MGHLRPLVLLTVTLCAAFHGSAQAQVVGLSEYVEFEPFIDLTYTEGGQQVHCVSPDIVGGPRSVEAVLDPNVGASDVVTQRFFCGDIALDFYRELTVAEIRVDNGAVFPIWAYYNVKITVTYEGGAGLSVVVYERDDFKMSFGDGTGHWPFITEIINVPGVSFSNVVDDITMAQGL